MHRNKPRYSFHDQHIERLLEDRLLLTRPEGFQSLQANSSLFQNFCRTISKHETSYPPLTYLSWCSNGSKLIASTSREIVAWTYPNFFTALSYDFRKHHRDISCARIVPECFANGVVYADNSQIWMYDFEHFDPKKIVSCHSDKVFNLAFPNENPNVLLSTSVDGTVRQHDIRERCKGQCQNVMLDFQRAKRNSLADGPTGRFTLCSSDLSPSSNLIVVGGDDRFGRLFDRRFVPKDSPVIRYYCPKHLSSQFNVQKFYGMDPIRVSKVAFSPNEWEVLISYTKEHIYVMNINHAGANEDLYSPDDVVQMFKVDVNRPGIFHESERDIKMRDQVRELLKGCNTHDSIDLLDAFLSLPGRPIDHGVIYEWLCCRAKFLLERNWKNDAHMAIRDCDKARKIKNNDYKAFYYLSKALLRLGRVKEAFEPAQVAKSLAPLDQEDVKKLMKKVTRRRAGRTARNEDSRKWTDGWDRNWPNDFKATDMKQRFIGHVNIHEKRCDAGFLGPTGDYIVSASDDNRLYIWEKRSGRLIRTLKDSRPIGQLLQCHPLDFAVATASSDIVQIWAQGANGVQTDADDDLIAMDLNQWRLSWS